MQVTKRTRRIGCGSENAMAAVGRNCSDLAKCFERQDFQKAVLNALLVTTGKTDHERTLRSMRADACLPIEISWFARSYSSCDSAT